MAAAPHASLDVLCDLLARVTLSALLCTPASGRRMGIKTLPFVARIPPGLSISKDGAVRQGGLVLCDPSAQSSSQAAACQSRSRTARTPFSAPPCASSCTMAFTQVKLAREDTMEGVVHPYKAEDIAAFVQASRARGCGGGRAAHGPSPPTLAVRLHPGGQQKSLRPAFRPHPGRRRRRGWRWVRSSAAACCTRGSCPSSAWSLWAARWPWATSSTTRPSCAGSEGKGGALWHPAACWVRHGARAACLHLLNASPIPCLLPIAGRCTPWERWSSGGSPPAAACSTSSAACPWYAPATRLGCPCLRAAGAAALLARSRRRWLWCPEPPSSVFTLCCRWALTRAHDSPRFSCRAASRCAPPPLPAPPLRPCAPHALPHTAASYMPQTLIS